MKQIHTIYLPDLLKVTDLSITDATFGSSNINNLVFDGLDYKNLNPYKCIFNSHFETFNNVDGAYVINLPTSSPIDLVLSVDIFSDTNKTTFYIQNSFNGTDWNDEFLFKSDNINCLDEFTPECKCGINSNGNPCIFIGHTTDNYNYTTSVKINYIITTDSINFEGWSIIKTDSSSGYTNFTPSFMYNTHNIVGDLKGSFLKCFDKFKFGGEDFEPNTDEDFITKEWCDDNLSIETIGDVVSVSGSVNDNFAVFDGVTGKVIKDAGVNVADKCLKTDIITLNNNVEYIPLNDYNPATKKYVLDLYSNSNQSVWYGKDSICLSGEITTIDKVSFNEDSGYVAKYTISDVNNKDNAKTGILKCILTNNVEDVYQQQMIEHDPSVSFDKYGYTVDIAGDVCCVGALNYDGFGSNKGGVFYYKRENNLWTLKQTFVDNDLKGAFGKDLSLNENGNVLVVRTSNSFVIFNMVNELWTEVFTDDKTTGQDDTTTINNTGNIIVIGSISSDVVSIYSGNGSNWFNTQNIEIEDENFGIKVKLSGNGKVLVVTSCYDNEIYSNVKIYKLINGTYQFYQELLDNVDGSRFGEGISTNYDGSIVFIGADKSDDISFENGICYVYNDNGSSYTLKQTIRCSSQDIEIRFGRRIELSDDARIVYISAFLGNNPTKSGRVFGYLLQDNGYYAEFCELISDPTQSGSRFGETISISNSGFDLIVGSPERNEPETRSGAAFIFTTPIFNNEIIHLDTENQTDDITFSFNRENTGIMNLKVHNNNTNDWIINLERIVI